MKNDIPQKKQEKWGSQFGVIIAVVGSAVGLGNFLRFPGQAAIYGGVSFMIPYFISFLLIGLPLAWTEWALGRAGGDRGFHSVPGILRSITGKRWAAYLGSLGIMVPALIFMYYVLLESWCLVYAVRYLFGSMHLGDLDAFKTFFSELSCVNENGAMFSSGGLNFRFGAFIFCFVVNFWLIYRGIARGIEAFCKCAMPLLILFSIIILIRVLTLGNPTGIEGQSVQDGLGYVWNPIREGQTIWSSLSNAEAWLAAAGQVFFSLSLGMGIIITYASYMEKNDDIALSCLTAASGNGFCEVVLASIMIVPAAVMFLGPAFMTAENLNSSFTIGFQALPQVFDLMPFGQVFGFFFFALLFLAAITSSVSILQPTIAFVEEAFETSRHTSVLILAVINFAGASFIAYFSKGLTALDTIDFWIANFFLFLIAGLQVFVFAWILGIDKGIAEIRRGAHIPIPGFMKFVIKYVSPTYLLVIFLSWVYRNLPQRWEQIRSDPVVQLSIGLILLVAVACFLVTLRSLKRWEKREDESFS